MIVRPWPHCRGFIPGHLRNLLECVRVKFLGTTDNWTRIVSDNGVGVSTTSVGIGSKILATLLRALGADLVNKSGPEGTSAIAFGHRRAGVENVNVRGGSYD